MTRLDEMILGFKETLAQGNTQEILPQIYGLSHLQDRSIYPLLLPLVKNPELGDETVKALANLNDSRALFPLLHFFGQTTSAALHQRVLQYCYATGDPRAVDFLEAYLQDSSKPFQDIANTALSRCREISPFHYRFCGSDEDHQRSLSASGRIVVTSENLDQSIKILTENKRDRGQEVPQTYVVTPDLKMYVGGTLNEHVQVAQGSDVLAAGEVELEPTEDSWEVTYLNNRSNGYHPARNSFIWVKKALEFSGVVLKQDKFSETFPRDGYADPEFLDLFTIKD